MSKSVSTPGPGGSAESGFWIPAGKAVTLAGYEIPGGLLYVGRGLKSLPEHETEPALIDSTLKIDRGAPDHAGQGMSYWPAYATISPACRAAYLTWLAGGRTDPDAYIGYVFLFFYGLERRLVGGIIRGDLDTAEKGLILSELKRLLSIYGRNASFGGYASRLLEVVESLGDLTGLLDSPPPEAVTYDSWPLLLKIGLGIAVRDQRPLPATWAYSWMRFGIQYWPRTPATRCRQEFERLFEIRYREKFGEGIIPKRSKKVIQGSYAPASRTFGGIVEMTIKELPDVTGQTAILGPLREVADRCTDELDAYSRWLGKNPGETANPRAVALLPVELVGTEALGPLGSLIKRFESDAERGPVVVPALEVWQAWAPGSVKAPKSEFVQLVQTLGRYRIAVEPDPRFGGSLDLDGAVAVFRSRTGSPTMPSPEYVATALFLDVGMAVSLADGAAGDRELELLHEYLDAVVVGAAERDRLEARMKWLQAKPPGVQGIKKRVEGLTAPQKTALCQLLLAIVAADGLIDPGEIKLLTKLYPMLGREPSQVYTDIHSWDTSDAPTDAPVEIVAAEEQQGVTLPPKALAAVRIDMEKVRAKLQETALVGAILGDVFQADEPHEEVRQETPTAQMVEGLDQPHSNLALALAGRSVITRDEFSMLAKEAGLLPEGALETLNEWGYDRAGVPLLDGDDELEIDTTTLKEVLA